MAAKSINITLVPVKSTDNKIVFAEKLGDDPLATRRITGLYIDKRDLRDLGLDAEHPALNAVFTPSAL